MQRHVTSGKPGDESNGVEVQLGDGLVGVGRRPSVGFQYRYSRFVGRGPHVSVRFHLRSEPLGRINDGAIEHEPEVEHFDATQVLHQAQQIGASRRQRAPSVVLVEALEFPDHSLAGVAEVVLKIVFQGVGRHVVVRFLKGRTEAQHVRRTRIRPVLVHSVNTD